MGNALYQNSVTIISITAPPIEYTRRRGMAYITIYRLLHNKQRFFFYIWFAMIGIHSLYTVRQRIDRVLGILFGASLTLVVKQYFPVQILEFHAPTK